MPKKSKDTAQPSKEKDEKEEKDEEEEDLSSESADDDDSLVLEGVMVRNPDVSSSSDDDSDNDDDDDDDDDGHAKAGDDSKPPAKDEKAATSSGEKRTANYQTTASNKNKSNKKKKKKNKNDDGIDMVHVDFIFCDMDEKYWGGIKALLTNGASLYHAHSSILADQMIEHEMVGTVIGTENDPEDSVYGFGSLLHWAHFATAQDQFRKVCCQQVIHRPHKNMPQLLDEEATRQAVTKALQKEDDPTTAFLLFGRMVNLPLEIVLALHQQLWLDIEYALKQKDADELPYAGLKTVLRVAPCTRESDSNDWVYRYFDDEIMAGQATGKYVVEAPKSFSREDKVYLQVLQLDVKGYQRAIQDLERMVGSG